MDVFGMMPVWMQGGFALVFYGVLAVAGIFTLIKKRALASAEGEEMPARVGEEIRELLREAIGFLRTLSDDVSDLKELQRERIKLEVEERAFQRGLRAQNIQRQQSEERVRAHVERRGDRD